MFETFYNKLRTISVMESPTKPLVRDITDIELVSLAKKGNLSAFEEIVKRYQKQIFFYAKKKVHDPDTAEDIAQETFVRAFEHLASFEDGKPISPWLYTIAKNASLDHIRKNKRLVAMDFDREDTTAESALEKIIRLDEYKRLWQALTALPDKYRQSIEAFYFQNMSYEAIAQNLALPINTIRTHIRRGKMILAAELAPVAT